MRRPGSPAYRSQRVFLAHARRYNESVATPLILRTFNQVSSFFDGLDLVEPGIVQCHNGVPNRAILSTTTRWQAGARSDVSPDGG